MTRFRNLLTHAVVILSICFAVFLALDQFNPMMNFVDNDISRWMLAALCLSGIAQGVLGWALQARPRESEK